VKADSPVLNDVSIEDLPKNPFFLTRAFFLYGFLVNFVVKVMDNEAVLRDSLQRLEAVGELYPLSLSKKTYRQNMVNK